MKRIGVVVFWALCAIFAVPAILGIMLAIIVVVLCLALGVAAVLASLALAAISCIPIIWLCGVWDGTRAQSLLHKIKAQSSAAMARQ